MGSGPNRENALAELQALLEDYLETVAEVTEEGGHARLFNPSAESDWNRPDAQFEDYAVTVDAETIGPPSGTDWPSTSRRLQDILRTPCRIRQLRLDKLVGV